MLDVPPEKPDQQSVSLSRIRRCCDGHADLSGLADHLVRDFQLVPEMVVRREVSRAHSAVTDLRAAAEDQGLVITELIARNQLLLLNGDRADAAHLDPQRHPVRGTAGETL